jgi:hypothetical protein
MVQSRFQHGLLVLCACCLLGCGEGTTQPVATNPANPPVPQEHHVIQPVRELPALANLPRTASGFEQVNGSTCIASANATVSGYSLVLSLVTSEANNLGKHFTGRQASTFDGANLAYAIYRFSNVTGSIAGLKIHSPEHGLSPVWLGFADWDAQHWVFPVEPKYSSIELWQTKESVDFDHFISSDNELVLAVILADDQESVQLDKLELVYTTNITDLQASSSEEDCIKLEWKNPSRALGTVIARRQLSGEADSPWSQLTDEPLSGNVASYKDALTEPGRQYEYSLSSGYGPNSEPEAWSWSDGEKVIGARLASHVDLPENSVDHLLPVNWYNQLGFVGYTPGNQPAITCLQADGFPPGLDWHWLTSTSGLTSATLAYRDGLPTPLAVFQNQINNNPVTTLCYSTSAGVFAQVATIDEAGAVAWLDPVQVRSGPHHVLACFQMSRRIGLLTWNTNRQRMEVIDSRDMYGQYWFDFSEWDWPWRVIESPIPDGSVSSWYSMVGETLCYCESGSNLLKVLIRTSDGWQDSSPGITCAPSPKFTELVIPSLIPGFGAAYITEDRTAIKVVRREFINAWNIDHLITVHECPAGSQITDLALYSTGSLFQRSYLAYIEDGKVYCCSTSDAGLNEWSTPKQIDETGTCEQLAIIRIGTDTEYSYGIYVTYVNHTPEGDQRFYFRAVDKSFIPLP